MTTRSRSGRKKAPSRQLVKVIGELEVARRQLDQVQAVLGDSEERRVKVEGYLELAQSTAVEDRNLIEEMRSTIRALRDEVRLTDTNYTHVARQLQAEMANGQNSGDAAAVLAYLLMPSGSLNAILANFQQTAVKLGLGPEVKAAATEAITRASAAFLAGEWPDDKLRERTMAEGGPVDLTSMLSIVFGGGPRRTRGSSPRDPLADIFGGGEVDLDALFGGVRP